MYTIIVLDYKQSIKQARQVKIKNLKTTKIPLFCNPAPKQSHVNLQSSEVNRVKTLLTQQFKRKTLSSMKEILSLSYQKDVDLVQVLQSLLQSKCFIQKITKVKLLL